MGAHKLLAIARDVVNFDATREFYREFGLTESGPGDFSSTVGEQLYLTAAARPRVTRIDIGVDDVDDLTELAERLGRLGVTSRRLGQSLEATEPSSGVLITLTPAPRLPEEFPYQRTDIDRADLVPRDDIRPVRLGHIGLGCPDVEKTKAFFVDGLGMRLSDYVQGSPFLRFGTDHHNLVLVSAPSTMLHHTAWKVGNVDEIGHGGSRMIASHPERHAWGLGRHAASANYFWYLKDPSGAFAEYYYSELDEMVESPLFWDPDPDVSELPIAAWASPALVPNAMAPSTPEEMPIPALTDLSLSGTRTPMEATAS